VAAIENCAAQSAASFALSRVIAWYRSEVSGPEARAAFMRSLRKSVAACRHPAGDFGSACAAG
jgi:hypothetical protein